MDFTFQLFKELIKARGIPGDKAPTREIELKYLNPLGDLSQNRFGSVICQKNGTPEAPRVMFARYLEDINPMDRPITKEGFINFISRRQDV